MKVKCKKVVVSISSVGRVTKVFKPPIRVRGLFVPSIGHCDNTEENKFKMKPISHLSDLLATNTCAIAL